MPFEKGSILVSPSSYNGQIIQPSSSTENLKTGMNLKITTFFLIAQMAGVGFLKLPSALASTGWIGAPLLVIFACSVGYSGVKLGQCWVILEERWPEYKQPVRQPYMEIAYRSFGNFGRHTMQAAVLITLIGSSIVIIILISQFLNSLIPHVTTCSFICIVALGMVPLTWLGTPKDFWQASVLATLGIFVSCIVIFTQLLLDTDESYFPEEPSFPNPTVSSFSLGFATILFAFGGASVFPTIQNDMEDKTKFWKCVVFAFANILCLYFPVATTGYGLMGYEVPDNILLYRGTSKLSISLQIAIAFEVLNLISTFLLSLSPVFQSLEEMLNVPPKFGIPRVVFRTALIIFDLVIALALPDFGYILNLVGGSTITLCSFLAPPLIYLKLVDDTSNKEWPERDIPLWERLFLYEIIFVAFVGGVCSTISAVIAIVTADFSQSCFADFTGL